MNRNLINLVAVSCFCFISFLSVGQDTPSAIQLPTVATAPNANEEIFKMVEEMPRFPGCEDQNLEEAELKKCAAKKMVEYIGKHLVYPEEVKQKGIEGTVVVQFVITKNGSLTSAKVIRDVGESCEISCGKSALNLLDKMKSEIQWIPGKQRGKKVNVQYTLPLQFKL